MTTARRLEIVPRAARGRLRRPAALLAAWLTGLALLLAVGTPPAAADQRPTLAPDESLSVANQAAAWLANSRTGRRGEIDDASGHPDPVSTGWAALAMRAAGLAPESQRPTRWLTRHLDELARDGNADSPAGLAMLILVARAQDQPAESFGGQDLVARLLATRSPDGLFGAPRTGPKDPVGGVPARQGLVLSALGAAGRTDAGAAAWLEQRQCPDGGWQFRRVDPRSACTATPETTGYAIQGLAAVGREVPATAIDALARLQRPDGGFSIFGAASDAFATALGLQGLIAAGQDPNTERWRKGTGADSATPFVALLRFATDVSGGFSLQPNVPPEAALTSRVIIAAAGQPLPLTALEPLNQDGTTQDPAGSGSSSGSGSSGGTAAGGDAFSPIPLLGGAALVLAVVGTIYAYRRRQQAL